MAREPQRHDGLPLKLSASKQAGKPSFRINKTSAIYQALIGGLVILLIVVALFCGGNTANRDKAISELRGYIGNLENEIDAHKTRIEILQQQNTQLKHELTTR